MLEASPIKGPSRSLIATTFPVKGDIPGEVGRVFVDHADLHATVCQVPIVTLNAGMAKEQPQKCRTLEGASPPAIVSQRFVTILKTQIPELVAEYGLDNTYESCLLEYCRNGTYGSMNPAARFLSAYDRKHSLTDALVTNEPFIFYRDSPPPKHALRMDGHDDETILGIQELAVTLYLFMLKECFKGFPKYPGLRIESSTQELVDKLCGLLNSLLQRDKCIIFLQEFRGNIDHVLNGADIVTGSPPTPTHPTVAIILRGITYAPINDINDVLTVPLTTLFDASRIVAVLCYHESEVLHEGGEQDRSLGESFVALSFHGDVGEPGKSLNETVAFITNNCQYPVVYGGDYQGGKKGADPSIFAGSKTPKIATRELPISSIFGPNSGVKSWAAFQ